MHRASWEDSVRRLFGRIPAAYAYNKTNCFDWKKSCLVAQEHLRWLEERQVKMGITPTKISLYMSYNLGNTGAYRYAFDYQNPRLPALRRRIYERAVFLLHTK
jgi:isocitrate lyase